MLKHGECKFVIWYFDDDLSATLQCYQHFANPPLMRAYLSVSEPRQYALQVVQFVLVFVGGLKAG